MAGINHSKWYLAALELRPGTKNSFSPSTISEKPSTWSPFRWLRCGKLLLGHWQRDHEVRWCADSSWSVKNGLKMVMFHQTLWNCVKLPESTVIRQSWDNPWHAFCLKCSWEWRAITCKLIIYSLGECHTWEPPLRMQCAHRHRYKERERERKKKTGMVPFMPISICHAANSQHKSQLKSMERIYIYIYLSTELHAKSHKCNNFNDSPTPGKTIWRSVCASSWRWGPDWWRCRASGPWWCASFAQSSCADRRQLQVHAFIVCLIFFRYIRYCLCVLVTMDVCIICVQSFLLGYKSNVSVMIYGIFWRWRRLKTGSPKSSARILQRHPTKYWLCTDCGYDNDDTRGRIQHIDD